MVTTNITARMWFYTTGLLIHPQDVGPLMDILTRAQPCKEDYNYSSGTSTYELQLPIATTLKLVPTQLIKYPLDLRAAVEIIREEVKDG